MKQKEPIKVDKLELETFLENCSKLLPHLWNILMLNLEIINRQLEPIKDFIEANKSISKSDDETIQNMFKNNCDFSDEKLKFFIEILKNKKAITWDLEKLNELLTFLKQNGLLEIKLEPNRKLDDIDTNIKWVQDLQNKEKKS